MRRRMFLLPVVLASLMMFSMTALAQQKFTAHLTRSQEVPPTSSNGSGYCTITLNATETQISVACTYNNLTSNLIADHIHGNATPGANAGVLFNFNQTGGTSGSFTAGPFTVTPTQVADMRAHRWYVNLHSTNFPNGEIRGQIKQAKIVYDADGDGRTDLTVFRQSNNTFYSLNSLSLSNPAQPTYTTTGFGSGSGDIFLNNTGDFDGDGRADPLLLKLDATNSLIWQILQSRTNTIRIVRWGNFSAANSEQLAPGDYDGDGQTDIAVYRRATGTYYIIESSTGNPRYEVWGTANDYASVGDYDKDGKDDLTAVRQESGNWAWYIRRSSDNTVQRIVWGATATDNLFFFTTIDVDGDGAQDILVSRTEGSQRVYYVRRSSDGGTFRLIWGLSADAQLFGDYDGDGRTDFVARRTEGTALAWYIYQSSNGQGVAYQFGTSTDQLFEPTSIFPISSEE